MLYYYKVRTSIGYCKLQVEGCVSLPLRRWSVGVRGGRDIKNLQKSCFSRAFYVHTSTHKRQKQIHNGIGYHLRRSLFTNRTPDTPGSRVLSTIALYIYSICMSMFRTTAYSRVCYCYIHASKFGMPPILAQGYGMMTRYFSEFCVRVYMFR